MVSRAALRFASSAAGMMSVLSVLRSFVRLRSTMNGTLWDGSRALGSFDAVAIAPLQRSSRFADDPALLPLPHCEPLLQG